MLRRAHRRVPAPWQDPVATYYTAHGAAGQRHHPLYLVLDTVPLPPLTPGRQARWDTARTCQDCGHRQLEPIPISCAARRAGAARAPPPPFGRRDDHHP